MFGGETEDRLWVVKRDHDEETAAAERRPFQDSSSTEPA